MGSGVAVLVSLLQVASWQRHLIRPHVSSPCHPQGLRQILPVQLPSTAGLHGGITQVNVTTGAANESPICRTIPGEELVSHLWVVSPWLSCRGDAGGLCGRCSPDDPPRAFCTCDSAERPRMLSRKSPHFKSTSWSYHHVCSPGNTADCCLWLGNRVL